jgi:hypothetical protein
LASLANPPKSDKKAEGQFINQLTSESGKRNRRDANYLKSQLDY